MPSIPVMAAIACGVLLLALAGTGWALKSSYERNGKLEYALTTATTRLTELNNAVKERDRIDGTNRALSDDDLFNGLLDAPATNRPR